jgi:hypothetical protein
MIVLLHEIRSSRMTALAAAAIQPLPPRPAASLFEWASAINGLAARAGSARKGSKPTRRGNTEPAGAGRLLLTGGELDAGSVPHRTPGSEALGYRMAPEVAEHLAIDGLDPDFLGDIAGFSGLDSRDVLDFAGIDRTTVSRRNASDGGNGLYGVVSPSGSKSFRYDYRLGGRRETLTIGRHEPAARHAQRSHLAYGMDVTLEAARLLLARARVDVLSGRSAAVAQHRDRGGPGAGVHRNGTSQVAFVCRAIDAENLGVCHLAQPHHRPLAAGLTHRDLVPIGR